MSGLIQRSLDSMMVVQLLYILLLSSSGFLLGFLESSVERLFVCSVRVDIAACGVWSNLWNLCAEDSRGFLHDIYNFITHSLGINLVRMLYLHLRLYLFEWLH
jgi:hypothetical protein